MFDKTLLLSMKRFLGKYMKNDTLIYSLSFDRCGLMLCFIIVRILYFDKCSNKSFYFVSLNKKLFIYPEFGCMCDRYIISNVSG